MSNTPNGYKFYADNFGKLFCYAWGLLDLDERTTPVKIEGSASEEYAKWVADALHAMKDIPDPAAFVAAVRELVASYDGSESMWGRTPTINWERVELIAAMLKGDSNA